MFLPKPLLVAHFDGKLLPDFDGTNYDCLPVVVSGKDLEIALDLHKIHGTGVIMGKRIVKLLQGRNDVSEWLDGLCIDTTFVFSIIITF